MKFSKWIGLLAFCLSFSAIADEGLTQPLPGQEIGQFRNTHYYVVDEAEYLDKPVNTRIYGMKNEIIARVSMQFKKAVDIEGTGKLRDGRIINFAGRIKGQIRYKVTPLEYGIGVKNCALEPWHTIAVDPTWIPLGTIVQIDETVGLVLPDGSVHNGIWRAEDVGGAIKKDRIDLFVGIGNHAEYLKSVGITHLKPLTVRLVQPTPADSCVNATAQQR